MSGDNHLQYIQGTKNPVADDLSRYGFSSAAILEIVPKDKLTLEEQLKEEKIKKARKKGEYDGYKIIP